jgi:Ca2+-binding RTX toxin-like protein
MRVQQLLTWLGNRKAPGRRPTARPRLESLEDRLVLASINWVNRLTASDTFTAAERAVVDQAIRTWENIIRDFDNDAGNGTGSFDVTITGGSTSGLDLGDTTAGQADQFDASDGTPQSARIQIDADAGGNDAGWYIDPNPLDHAEFTTLLTRFTANGGPAGLDLYSVVLHEVGHAVGFTVNHSSFANRVTNNPPPATTRTYTGAGGLTATLVAAGQGTHLDPTAHANDVMNPSFPDRTRFLPTDLAARLLADAYGYQVALPSTRQTFLANLNTTTGVLTVNSDPQVVNDVMTIDRQGTNLLITVDGAVATIPVSSVTAITVLAGGGNDTINLERIQALIPVTVEAGTGSDTIQISPTARQVANLLGSIITVRGGGGTNDRLIVRDDGQGSGGTYTVEAGSVARIFGPPVHYSDVDEVTLHTSWGGSTVRVRSTSASTRTRVNAGSAVDTFNVGNTSNQLDDIRGELTLTGGIGADRLNLNDQGAAAGQTWTVDTGFVQRSGAARINHSSMEGGVTLNTGERSDTVTLVSANQPIPYTVNGNGGVDVMIVQSSNTTLTLNGGAGADTIFVQVGVGTLTVDGGADSDTLVGPNHLSSNTWDITGNDAGTLNGWVGFSAVENLRGGTQQDLFVIGHLVGMSGRIEGRGGYNQLEYWRWTTPVFVHLETRAARGVFGGAAGGFSDIDGYIGGSGADDLTGANAANTWNITAAGAGNVNNAFWFSRVENLGGGSQADQFVVADGVSFAGFFGGGGGSDTLDFSAFTAARPANTWTFGAFGFGGLNGVLGIAQIEDILGGANPDRFVFAVSGLFGSQWARDLDGGGGSDTLDYSAFATEQVTVNLGAQSATRVGGQIRNLEEFIGGQGTDTLVGSNVFNTWRVRTANNQGTVNGFGFRSVEHLTGGTGQDRFLLDNGLGVSGTIHGGGSTDSLDYTAYLTKVEVNLAAGTATNLGGIASIEIVKGGAGDDVLTGDALGNVLIGSGGRDQLNGGPGNDLLIGGDGIDTGLGGAGEDILIGGWTDYDSNIAALKAIMDEWTQQGVDYLIRYDNVLRGQGLTGGAYLNPQQVDNDFDPDTLIGAGPERDWFFVSLLDNPVDWDTKTEKRTNV